LIATWNIKMTRKNLYWPENFQSTSIDCRPGQYSYWLLFCQPCQKMWLEWQHQHLMILTSRVRIHMWDMKSTPSDKTV
jgi:hypothetical protein